ncbi:MAG: alpha/beta hydrolase [Treponemataceae bacterium]
MIIVFLILFGLALFGIAGGWYIFNSFYIRKDAEKNLATGFSKVWSSVQDKKIISVIRSAKEQWHTKQLEIVSVKSSDLLNLSGDLWLNKNGENKIALLIHGFRDSSAGMAYLAQEYHERGFSVLAVNCRAHGNSEGKIVGMGYKDAQDLVLWIDFLIQRFGQNSKIILHGISMGGAAVLTYTGLKNKQVKNHNKNLILFISDSAFSSFSKQVDFQFKRIISGGGFQSIFRFFLLLGISLVCFFQNGFFHFQHDPAKKVSNRLKNNLETIPLIIFHGLADTVVLPEHAQRNFSYACGKVQLECVVGAPHIGAYFYEPENYFSVIMSKISDSSIL